jgi:hypothetical protein
MSHKTFTSGTGAWCAYFETGRLVDGTKELFILRRVTKRAAKIAALEQARFRELPHVHVMRRGVSVWCTCSLDPKVERKCMGA